MELLRKVGAGFCLLATTGCVAHATGERSIGRYLGYVEVRTDPATAGEPAGVRRTRVLTLGGWLETSPRGDGVESVGAGWRSSRLLIVPEGCRLVVIVKSDAELISARAVLNANAIQRGEQCVVKDSD
jgi:hypothetical protein